MDAIRFPTQPSAAGPVSPAQPARPPQALTASGVAALRAYGQPAPLRLQREQDGIELSADAGTPRVQSTGDASGLRAMSAGRVPVTDELVRTVGAPTTSPSAPAVERPARTASGAMAMYRSAAQYNAAATGVAVGGTLDAEA